MKVKNIKINDIIMNKMMIGFYEIIIRNERQGITETPKQKR